jgi:hypothetical protein
MHAWKQKEARRDCKDPLLTSPSAASRASSSVTIAPDQDGKKRKESEKKGKKERKNGSEREGGFFTYKSSGRLKSWWALSRPFLCQMCFLLLSSG